MSDSNSVSKRHFGFQVYLVLALLTLGLVIKVWIRTPPDLWEDEIIAATHAAQPLGQVLISTIRNDVHPPLYFVQLHFWQLLSQSDVWLIGNSILWSLIGAGSLWWVVKQHFGDHIATFACAAYEVMPSTAYMANQVRMYAMLAVLIIWAFHFAVLTFKYEKRTARNALTLVGILICILFTHAIGVIAVASNGLFTGVIVAKSRRGMALWALIYGFAAVISLPWLLSGLMHDANLHEGVGAFLILQPLGSSILGILANYNVAICVIGAIIFIATTIFGLCRSQTNSLAVCFVALPILLSLATLFYKPIFKWNFFSTAIGPFAAIIIATALTERRSIAAFCGIICVAALAGTTIYQRATFQETSGYRHLSDLIRINYRPGDIVYVPQQSNFWGIAHYLIGPDWGSPLRIAAPPSSQWQKVYSLLGSKVVAALGLMPDTQMIDKNGYVIVTGPTYKPPAVNIERVWTVTLPRADLPAGYPPAELNGLPTQWRDTKNTWITLYAAQHQSITFPRR